MLRPLLLVLAVTLAGCGPSATTTPGATTPTTTTAAAAAPTKTPEQIAAAIATLPAPYSEGNYDAGRRVFGQCRSCHSINADGVSRGAGPSLYGVFGRRAGSSTSYPRFSPALRASTIVWDATNLDHWLENPTALVPHAQMPFRLANPTQRRDVIAYIRAETTE